MSGLATIELGAGRRGRAGTHAAFCPGRHRNGEENGNQRIVTPSKPGARPVLKGTELTSAQVEPSKRAKCVHRWTDTLVVRTVTCDNLDSGYDNIFL